MLFRAVSYLNCAKFNKICAFLFISHKIFLIQIPLGAWSGLGTQTPYEASCNTFFEEHFSGIFWPNYEVQSTLK